jgi:hypothetical protein
MYKRNLFLKEYSCYQHVGLFNHFIVIDFFQKKIATQLESEFPNFFNSNK